MAATEMKAVQYTAYNGELKNVNLPVPVAKKGEILVKVEVTTMNGIDYKINEGIFRPMMPKFPFTPGLELAGEVVNVGANVQDFAPGDKIATILPMPAGGAFAEYAIAVPKTSAKIPPEVPAVDAACLGIAGITALQSLTNSGVNVDGSYTGNVLILAATGGVGLYAIQLAKLSGAHVTVTVGARNMELVKSLGADEVLDYKTPEGAKFISPSGKKYDVVVNGSGAKWSALQPQLSPTGRVQELTPNISTFVSSFLKRWSKQKYTMLISAPNDKDLVFLLDLAAAGKLKTFVDSKFPFENIKDAWAKCKDGHATGKIVITVVEE